jgi:hypothetical protein
MTKLIVAFHSFAKAPKNGQTSQQMAALFHDVRCDFWVNQVLLKIKSDYSVLPDDGTRKVSKRFAVVVIVRLIIHVLEHVVGFFFKRVVVKQYGARYV